MVMEMVRNLLKVGTARTDDLYHCVDIIFHNYFMLIYKMTTYIIKIKSDANKTSKQRKYSPLLIRAHSVERCLVALLLSMRSYGICKPNIKLK